MFGDPVCIMYLDLIMKLGAAVYLGVLFLNWSHLLDLELAFKSCTCLSEGGSAAFRRRRQRL